MDEQIIRELSNVERLINNGDQRTAISKINKIITREPNCAQAYFLKAEAQVCIPKIPLQEIISNYQKAISLDTQNAEYYRSFGSFCLSIGNFDEAEKAYIKAAELDKENGPYYLSDFAIEYYHNATSKLDEAASNEQLDAIRKKTLLYFLKSLELEPEEAIKILQKK